MNEPLALLAIPDTEGQTWYVPLGDISGIVDRGEKRQGLGHATYIERRGTLPPIYSPASAAILVASYHDIIRARSDTKPAYHAPLDLDEYDG